MKKEGCELSSRLKQQSKLKLSGQTTPSRQTTDTKSENYQQKLSHAIAILLSSYTRAINKQEGRSGSLFRSKTKAKDGWIDELITVGSKQEHRLFRHDNDYAYQCFHYIHQNPVKARLVRRAEDWKYSSARDFAGLRNGTLCNKEKIQELLF